MKVQQSEDGGSEVTFINNAENLSSVEQIQVSLILILIARQKAFPGDGSVITLLFFLASNNWFYFSAKSLNKGQPNTQLQVMMLNRFIDEVLQANGRNFRKKLGFETVDRLFVRMQNLISYDSVTKMNLSIAGNNYNNGQPRQAGNNRNNNNRNNNNPPGQPQQPRPNNKNNVPKSNEDFGESLCKHWNNGTCNRNVSNITGNCITSQGRELKHKCNFRYNSIHDKCLLVSIFCCNCLLERLLIYFKKIFFFSL